MIDWLQHERVTRRAAAGLAIGVGCMYLAWTAGYLLLPEGALRGRTGAGVISALLPVHASVFVFALVWNSGVAFVVVPLVSLLAVKRLCLGYVLAWGNFALFGLFLGTNSFSIQRPGPVAPGVSAFASTGTWEITAYLLVAAALANRSRFRQSGWLGGRTTRIVRTGEKLDRAEWLTLIVAAALVVATASVEDRRASSGGESMSRTTFHRSYRTRSRIRTPAAGSGSPIILLSIRLPGTDP
jgi:hypothetical protein